MTVAFGVTLDRILPTFTEKKNAGRKTSTLPSVMGAIARRNCYVPFRKDFDRPKRLLVGRGRGKMREIRNLGVPPRDRRSKPSTLRLGRHTEQT